MKNILLYITILILMLSCSVFDEEKEIDDGTLINEINLVEGRKLDSFGTGTSNSGTTNTGTLNTGFIQ